MRNFFCIIDIQVLPDYCKKFLDGSINGFKMDLKLYSLRIRALP